MGRSQLAKNQKQAAEKLELISRGGEEPCLKLAEEGAISVVAGLLAESKSGQVRFNSAKILRNLAGNPQLLEQMLDERVCPTLVSLVKFRKPSRMQETVIEAMDKIAVLMDAKLELLPAVPVLVEYLARVELEDQLRALSTLARISQHGKCQYKMVKDGALDTAFNVLLSEFHPNSHRGLAMKAVAELCLNTACHKYVTGYSNDKGIRIIVRLCQIQDVDVAPYACKTVERLAQDEDTALDLVDEGVLAELRWMLEHAEPIVNFTALEAVGALAEFFELQRILVEQKLLPFLIKFSSSPDQRMKQAAVRALALVSQHPVNRSRVIYNGGHEALLYHGKFAADKDLKGLAGDAAAEVLNLPAAKKKKTVIKAAQKFQEGLSDYVEEEDEEISPAAKQWRNRQGLMNALRKTGGEEESSSDDD